MRLMSVLMLTIFSINAFALPMNTANKEKQAKKRVALFVAQVQNTTDATEKEEMLNDFLNAFDKKVLSQDISNLPAEEAEAIATLRSNLMNGFDMVRGGTAADLDAYAEYLESEINQASIGTLIYIILVILCVYYGGYGIRIHIRL